MLRTLLILTIGLAGLTASAQSPYFIYLQAEPAQSFSLVYNEKTFRSSASGYIILPNLTDSVLQVAVRFADHKYPEQTFAINAQRSDQGYLLKHYGDKGWGLLDWRTLTVSYAQRPIVSKSNDIVISDQSDFATMLAKASGDSTLLDTASISKPVAITKAANDSKVTTTDKSKPVAESSPAAVETKPVVEAKPVIEQVKTVVVETKPVVTEEKPAPSKQPATIPVPSYCTSILSDAEFSECLSKVQVARSETSKVNVLREYIGSRCYTIDQVKALALLLTTDEVRYDFLLEAWTHTAERARYLVLASVFSSPATVDRFKEMFQ
jgi:hypothetical protein